MSWFDETFKKGWDLNKKFDPVTPRILEFGSKYTSKGVGEVAHGLGWKGLEREADKNTDDPARGIGRAAASIGLAYGGAAALGGGAGAGAGAGAAETAGGAGGLEGAGGLGAMEGTVGGGAPGEAGAISGAGGPPSWMNYARMGSKLMGGGGQQRPDMQRQNMLAEYIRQNALASAQNQMEANRGIGPAYP